MTWKFLVIQSRKWSFHCSVVCTTQVMDLSNDGSKGLLFYPELNIEFWYKILNMPESIVVFGTEGILECSFLICEISQIFKYRSDKTISRLLLCRLSQKPNTVCWFLGESTAHYGAQSPYCFIWPLKYSNMILWKLQDHLGKMFLDIVLARNQKFWRKIEILMFCHNGTFWHFDMFFNAFSRTHGKLTLRTYLFGHLKEKRKEKVTTTLSYA